MPDLCPETSDRLNAICPYYTMYPLDFPLRALRQARHKQWVLDPYCGRGTTNFAARLLGLNSAGIDASPVATAVASAKLIHVSAQQVVTEAQRILDSDCHKVEVPVGEFWRHAFHRRTLNDICRLRVAIGEKPSTPARVMLRALILGVLHGPLNRSLPSYFSNQCPRTFAPKPAYAVRFWKRHGLHPKPIDVVSVIRRRAEHCLHSQPDRVDGNIFQGDARKPTSFNFDVQFSWIITSPPYYGMRTYVPDQWLRNWFLGGPSYVPYDHPTTELQHSSPELFSDQLRTVWQNVESCSANNARLVCRFGGINDRNADPLEVIKCSFERTSWRLITIRDAGTAHNGKRQALQFGARGRSKPKREYDVYASLN
jgi:hypothetical protein